MHNIAIGIISITIAIVITYVLGRITIIIADCIQVKQQHKTISTQQMILQAAKKRHSGFDYGLMGFVVASALGLVCMLLEILGAMINQAL